MRAVAGIPVVAVVGSLAVGHIRAVANTLAVLRKYLVGEHFHMFGIPAKEQHPEAEQHRVVVETPVAGYMWVVDRSLEEEQQFAVEYLRAVAGPLVAELAEQVFHRQSKRLLPWEAGHYNEDNSLFAILVKLTFKENVRLVHRNLV